jgi:hypothetical protein
MFAIRFVWHDRLSVATLAPAATSGKAQQSTRDYAARLAATDRSVPSERWPRPIRSSRSPPASRQGSVSAIGRSQKCVSGPGSTLLVASSSFFFRCSRGNGFRMWSSNSTPTSSGPLRIGSADRDQPFDVELAELPCGLVAVHPRQTDVHQDDLRAPSDRGDDRMGAGRRAAGVVTPALQRPEESLSEVIVIFDDEHSRDHSSRILRRAVFARPRRVEPHLFPEPPQTFPDLRIERPASRSTPVLTRFSSGS